MRLLDQVRAKCRLKQFSLSTEQSYVSWIKRYILYHQKRHPAEIGRREIEAFLSYLAVNRRVSASTRNQALSALLFLYQQLLETPIEGVDAIRAKTPVRVPIVLSAREVQSPLDRAYG